MTSLVSAKIAKVTKLELISTASYVPPFTEYMNGLLDDLEKFVYEEDYIPVLVKTALIHSQFE